MMPRLEAATLRAELVTVEERLATFIAAEDGNGGNQDNADNQEPESEQLSAEERERRQLRKKASVGQIVASALGGQRLASGPTVDYLQASGIATEGQIPIDLLIEGATSVALPAAGLPTMPEPTVPSAFPSPMGDFLGVIRRNVGPGLHSVPTMSAPTSGPDAAVAEGAEVDDTTVTIGATALSPARLQVSAAWSVEDAATLASLEDDVRMVLRDAIADAIDRQALTKLFAIASTAADGTTETFALFQDTWHDRVDGRYAAMLTQVRAIVGKDTYAKLGKTYRANASNESALTWAEGNSGGLMVSPHAPAEDTGVQKALFAMNAQPRNAHQFIWPSISIIRDSLTQSKTGEVKATLVALAAVEINRVDGFHVEQMDLSHNMAALLMELLMGEVAAGLEGLNLHGTAVPYGAVGYPISRW